MIEIRSCLPSRYFLDSIDMYRFRNCYVWYVCQIPKRTLFSESQDVRHLIILQTLLTDFENAVYGIHVSSTVDFAVRYSVDYQDLIIELSLFAENQSVRRPKLHMLLTFASSLKLRQRTLKLHMLLTFASSLKLRQRTLRKFCLNGCCHYRMSQFRIALLDMSLVLYTSDFHLNWNKPYCHRHNAPPPTEMMGVKSML